jgi:hypothetical protein
MYDHGDTSNYNDDVNHAFDMLLAEEVEAFWQEVEDMERATFNDVPGFVQITDEWYDANMSDWYTYVDVETF